MLLAAYFGVATGVIAYNSPNIPTGDLLRFFDPKATLTFISLGGISSEASKLALLLSLVLSISYVCDSKLPRWFLLAPLVTFGAESYLVLLSFRTG